MGDCYICGEETDKGKKNFALGEWIYLCSRACDDEYDPYEAESFEAPKTDFQCYRCGLWYDTKNEAKECAKEDILYDREAESFDAETKPVITSWRESKNPYGMSEADVSVKIEERNFAGKLQEFDDEGNQVFFDADWTNAPYGSWDEAWSDQVTFKQSRSYFRPRNLALAGIAYWVAMRLRK